MIKKILKKIFSKKVNASHCIYRIFGIKFKVGIPNQELKQEYLDLNKKLFKGFCWSNRKNFTTDDKIRLFSQWFYESCGYYPNLRKPQSFNEKLNWMKFNYRANTKGVIINKYSFKDYIKSQIGDGYTVPLIKLYDDVCDINLDELPEKFVIKTTNGFGGKQVKIVLDKSKINLDALKYEFSCHLNRWFNGSIFADFFGRPNHKQRIIVEDYIEQLKGQVYDYKFFCFHGEPKCLFVLSDRFKHKAINWYDMDWNLLPFTRGARNAKYNIPKPELFDQMVEISRKLSAPFPFVRVDLYQVENKVLVGELTFQPGLGFEKFTPREWDYKLGEWLDLSKIPEENLKIMPEFVKGAKTFLDPELVKRCTIVEK